MATEEEEEAMGRGEGRVSLCDGIFKVGHRMHLCSSGFWQFPSQSLEFSLVSPSRERVTGALETLEVEM